MVWLVSVTKVSYSQTPENQVKKFLFSLKIQGQKL